MKKLLVFAGAAALTGLAACASQDVAGFATSSDEGYYDGYYGRYDGGYWDADGAFYYWNGHGMYIRDNDGHFRHQRFAGAKPFRADAPDRDRLNFPAQQSDDTRRTSDLRE